MIAAKDYVDGLRRGFESQLKAAVASGVSGTDFASPTSVSVFSSRDESEAYSHFRNWIYVCVNFIARRVAGQPLCAGELLGADANPERTARRLGRKDVLPSVIRQKAMASDVELLPTHDALDALEYPNRFQSRHDFVYMSVANLLLTGETYWLIGVDETDKLELWAVPTAWVIPGHDDGPYTRFRFKPPGKIGLGVELDPDSVIRTGFTNPKTLTGVWSPLHAITTAARTDDSLQYTQQQMFARGINPNIILTMAEQRGVDGKPTGTRPRLTGEQRQQMIRSIRQVWGNTLNYGDPAIVDGLIGGIHKLQMTPQEMDWINSGKILQDRIFKAFGLNPIVVGEIEGANRASAVMAEKIVCSNTLNPIVDALSTTLTNRIGPLYENPERLLLWLEDCKPTDPELDIQRWDMALRHNAVDPDELRTELLGLPPKEDERERSALASSKEGAEITMLVVNAVAQGTMDLEQGVNHLVFFLELDEQTARSLLEGTGTITIAPPEPEEQEDGELDEDEADEGTPEIDDTLRTFGGVVFDTLSEFEASVVEKVKAAVCQPEN